MTDKKSKKPELLAPAGSTNVFESAIEAGADAVYIGAPALNARALSKDFTFVQIAAMIEYAHKRGVKLYLAANSLMKENEIPQTLETLAILNALKPDALIIQDLGVYHLCKKYFPQLRVCLVGDSLYVNRKIIKKCEEYTWPFIITLKEGSAKALYRDYEAFKKLDFA